MEYGRPNAAYGHDADTLYEEAMMLGYAVCDLFGNVFRSIDEWRVCVDRLYWDYLLIPKERLEVERNGAREDRSPSSRRVAPAGPVVDAGPTPALARAGDRQSA